MAEHVFFSPDFVFSIPYPPPSPSQADIFVFVALVVVLLVGYGVASQAILFPSRGWDADTLVRIVFRPYFQIYGDPMLDSLREDSDCIGYDGTFTACGYKRELWVGRGVTNPGVCLTVLLIRAPSHGRLGYCADYGGHLDAGGQYPAGEPAYCADVQHV